MGDSHPRVCAVHPTLGSARAALLPGQGLSWLLSVIDPLERGEWGGGAVSHQPLIHLLPALLHSSDAREQSQRVTDLFKYGDSGHGVEDSRQDQEANEWGRSGKDPNHFRPAGLPDKY